ncbi:MAG TPA: hypothetical protein VF259_03935 [Solirubrobacterales bacterium]
MGPSTRWPATSSRCSGGSTAPACSSAPGLEELGDGNVGGLAEHLRDAFGATVVGLLVGTVAFAITLARTRMYTEDLAALEQGAERYFPTAERLAA